MCEANVACRKHAQALKAEGSVQRPARQPVQRNGQIIWGELQDTAGHATGAQVCGGHDTLRQGEGHGGAGGVGAGQGCRGTCGGDQTLGNYRDTIGEVLRLVHVVGGEQHLLTPQSGS